MVCAQSGHGKTSLLNFIYGISSHYDGSIDFVDDNSCSGLSTHELRNSVFSFLFQDLCLFPQLSALENVKIKNDLTDYKSDTEIMTMLDSLLPAEKKHQPVATLSLGQRQRVAAVRALCQPFRFLLLDEPFSHIDSINARKLADLVLAEVEARHAGLIVTALDAIDLFPFDEVLHL